MIISDQRMPGMSGVEFLKQAKTICPHAVRILVTGCSDSETLVHAVNQGEIHGYFTKPWDDSIQSLIERGLITGEVTVSLPAEKEGPMNV
jgi:response regulator RpfG family c-di-GMP phosphodiesterase